MEFVDTHCHVHFDSYELDPETTLNDAASAGVGRVICVGCTLGDSEKAIKFAQAHDNVWATVGAHPHDGADFLTQEGALVKFNELVVMPKVVAIGEIGLDYFRSHVPAADQQKSFRLQLEAGLGTGLPFVFHVREAWDDFWKIIDDYQDVRGVVHSFSADLRQLDNVLSRDLYAGLNGIMTFTKDEAQLAAAKQLPLEKMLLETDAPFLTPKPFRGQVCEPKHVVNTAEFLAHLRGEDLETLARVTTDNAVKLFGLENA
jgi:TatD DNase family protein